MQYGYIRVSAVSRILTVRQTHSVHISLIRFLSISSRARILTARHIDR